MDNLERLVDHLGQHHGSGLQVERAGADTGNVEDVGHQLRLNGNVATDGVDRAVPQLLVGARAAQDLGPSEDRVQRRPELVRQRREKMILRSVRFFGLAPRGLLAQQLNALFFRLLAIGDVVGDAHHPDRSAIFVDARTAMRRDHAGCSVGADHAMLERERFGGLDRMLDDGVDPRSVLRMDEIEKRRVVHAGTLPARHRCDTALPTTIGCPR